MSAIFGLMRKGLLMLDFSKTAFIFPGQGSQAVGMGKDIAEAYAVAQETIEQADDILRLNLSKLMFEGSQEELDDTAITQPAMYVCSVAMLRALQQEMPQAKPIFVAGHSLGEFTALTAAGALSFEAGVKLVRVRAESMQAAGEQNPGGMAAILGLEKEQVEQVVISASVQSGKVVVIANDNCPGQIVISGDNEALNIAVELAKEAGAKRALPLSVSVATHSPLMQAAKEQFSKALHETNFADATIPVYANVCACATHSVDAIRTNLEEQLTNSVRWTESIQTMIADGAETFVEIGSKNVLTGLMKRINRDATGISVQDLASLQKFMQIDT
jgi:[acyl-carrier-protein] S-malonyltransferase